MDKDWSSVLALILLFSRLVQEIPRAIQVVRKWFNKSNETGENDEHK